MSQFCLYTLPQNTLYEALRISDEHEKDRYLAIDSFGSWCIKSELQAGLLI